jgi:hypothetical protein
MTTMSVPQLLLSVGKRANHFYSVSEYEQDSDQDRVTLFWGGEPFVCYLDRDQREVRNTLAVGLVGAGMRQSDVCEVMQINRRQLLRYVHGHTSLTVKPGRPVLVTEEVRDYVRGRYRALCADGPRRWREQVAEEVAEKFHLRVKAPTLSAIVQPLAKSWRKESWETGHPVTEQVLVDDGGEPQPRGHSLSEAAEAEASEGEEPKRVAFNPPLDPTEVGDVQRSPTGISPSVQRSSVELEERLRGGLYSRYAGAMLLSPFIARILEGVLESERSYASATQVSFQSYLLSFLQMNTFGCNTYESAEGLHAEEFGPIVGLSRSPSLATLYRITPEFLSEIDTQQFSRSIATNYLQNLAVGSQLFYVDGHFQRYYGREKMMRTYHAQSHQMQKGYNQYALSTQDGSPFLLYDSDSLVNFQDAIGLLVRRLVDLMPEGVVPTVVFDRGGYNRELMGRFGGEQARRDQFAAHYISWEQFDATEYSGLEMEWQDMVLELKGNDADHPRELELKVAEAPEDVRAGIWAKNSPIAHHRKLILRQDYEREGKRRSLCTPICSSDHESAATDIVARLSLRWRQENAFKITDGDYGWDYISTYKTEGYSREVLQQIPPFLRETIDSRMIENPGRRRMKRQSDELRKVLGRIADRRQRLRRGEKLKTDQSRLRLPKDEQALGELYESKLAELDELEAKRLLLPYKVNRLEHLCENDFARLDFSKKWILDILRAAAHNVRRMALNTWMTVYPDWRDYTQRFRDLLRVGGVLQLKGRTLHVRLKEMPQPRYQHSAEAFVAKLRRLRPTTLGMGPYAIKFSFDNAPLSYNHMR